MTTPPHDAPPRRPIRAVIVGASGTLGQAIAKALAARGATLGLTYYRNEAAATALAKEVGRAHVRSLDLTVTKDIPRVLSDLASDLGGIDAFIHAAGVGSTRTPPAYDRLGDVEEEGYDRLFAVHARSAFFACQHLAGVMDGGNIVLLGSMNGVKSAPAPVPYAAATGALRAMTTALAKELGPKRILVNMVAPGILEAGLSTLVPADLQGEFRKHTSLKRLGTIAEVARVVAWMATENTYVTGQTVALDGGL